MFRHLKPLFLLATAAVCAAQPITYSEHIAPITYSNCTKCHRPGQVAPFSLLNYEDARGHGRTMVTVTQSHYMPPWKPEPGWAAYRDERHLTAEQIALIKQWVDGGMPLGDPAKAPLPPQYTDGWQLGAPDLILEMPAGFSVPADGPDVYRNFVIPTKLTANKWVRAIEVRPTARTVMHHSLFFSDNTGGAAAQEKKTVDGQPGFPGFGTIFTVGNPLAALNGGLGGWVPGTTPAFLPQGIAMPLPAGSDFLLQTHFHPDGLPHTEKTVIALYFGAEPPRLMTQLQVPAFFGVRANLDIPAGETDYKVRGAWELPVDVDAVGVWAHQHYLGKEAKLTATLPNGEVRILLWIRQWDFNWQDQYLFQNLVPLPKGTRLDGELTYDNSAGNYRNPNNPPKRVTWGENSTDEMGSLLLTVLPKHAEDITALQTTQVFYVLTPVPMLGSKPLFVSSGMVDGASAQPGAVTPGKIVVLYGSRLGPSTLTGGALGGDGKVATNTGGTQVLFDGVAAPILYASQGQVAAVVPYAVEGKTGTQVQVRNGSALSDKVALPVTPAAPSIFSVNLTGTGPAAILNQDGITVNSSKTPAAKGSYVSIYATGEGQTNPGGIDGRINSGGLLPASVRRVQAWVDGKAAEIQYAGAAPDAVAGLMQVNVRIPADVSSGDVPLLIKVGDATSQAGITVSVK
ncbi:MAG: IPT/TIG domain-containing protein [Candidatus Solibacter sp.]